MRRTSLLLLILCMAGIIFSCKKRSDDPDPTGPAVIFSSTFDAQSALDQWVQSSDGQATIEESAVKLEAVTGCFQFGTRDVIGVRQGRVYELKIIAKVNPSQPGDPAFCVGNFMIYIQQGSTQIISEGFGSFTDWTQKSYSFVPTTSASINIKFLIGTTRGVWIDSIELIER